MRHRLPAIMVEDSKEVFPELAKRIRNEVNTEVIGNHVIGMRQAKAGGLLIEVRGDTDYVERIRTEIEKWSGANFGVRSLQQTQLLEVRDLDEWTSIDGDVL